jgi:hypothetical protein
MRRKHAELRDHEPLPAMLIGDEALVPSPAAIVPAQASETASLLPGDLRVVVEGTTASRLPLLAAFLLLVVFFALGVFESAWMMDTGNERRGSYALLAGLCAVLGWLGHRVLMRYRKEFHLAEDGIAMEVWHPTDRKPWVTHIPWTEIEDYTVSVDREKAFLRVASVRGYTVTLHDRPPRLSTRELIRRFVEQAERYPRAVRPTPSAAEHPHWIGESEPSVWEALAPIATWFAVFVQLFILRATLDIELSPAQTLAILAGMAAIFFGLHVFTTLDDFEVALADRDSRRLVARLRRWLRRLLNIRVS